jgi:hypothetical protein
MGKVTVNPSLKKKLEAAIATKTAKVAGMIYNEIIESGARYGFPYYSGAYINSWDINQTGKGGNVQQGDKYEYSIPGKISVVPNINAPYQSWFVANSYGYWSKGQSTPGLAHQIEYEGSPTSTEGWKTLHNAVSAIKYF